MTTITILPEKADSYRALAGDKESTGRTAGEALDALASQLMDDEGGMLIIVQNHKADGLFNAAQRERLTELMKFRQSRTLSPEEEQELESLIEAELDGARLRAERTVKQLGVVEVGQEQYGEIAVAPPEPHEHSQRSLRVLVVADDDWMRELLADILEREGCEVARASEGSEALRLFDSREFDAVFTDVGLPGMSGWELARAVRERDERIALTVITAWGASPEGQPAAKADWVVAKPFTVDRITDLVREISQRRKSLS